MTLAISIIILIVLIINIITTIISSRKYINIADLETENARLEEIVKRMSQEIAQNKTIYGAELEGLLTEKSANELMINTYKEKLAEFTVKKQIYQSEMDNINNYSREMSPEELLEIRSEVLKRDSGLHDFTGIYILENKTVDKFYVGQSISLFKRSGAHFTGDGNKDIYEDYSNGEIWTVRLIALADSGFKSINALEKHFIEYYHSTYNGYNKTIGNAN